MDVGIDDAIAVLFLATQPDARIVALGSPFGDVDTAQATHDAIAVLELAGLGRVPVAHGAERPLAVPLSLATYVHGTDGLGEIGAASIAVAGSPTGESAADQIVRPGRQHPGELDLLAVGPRTNLGHALQADPDALGRYGPWSSWEVPGRRTRWTPVNNTTPTSPMTRTPRISCSRHVAPGS